MRRRLRVFVRPETMIARDDFGAYVFEGELDFEEESLDKIVRVRFVNSDGRAQVPGGYSYIDPFGNLEVGDLVDVPTKYSNHNLAAVVGFGRGALAPSSRLKTVSAKYHRVKP